jgi:octaprenyl-diphosphate synthase
MQEGSADERALIRDAITSKSARRLSEVVAAVQRCGSLDYTRTQARHYHDLALEHLQQLPTSTWRSALERITHLSIHRDH